MPRRSALPISLYVSGRRCVVAGDGPGARERASLLEAAGARVVRVDADAFGPDDCRGAFAVFAHGDDPEQSRAIAGTARAAGCLVYAHDFPDASDFAMPAVARRGPVAVAISTDAVAPALSRRLRVEIESLLASADGFDDLIADLEAARAALSHTERREALTRLASRLRLEGRIAIAPERTAPAAEAAPPAQSTPPASSTDRPGGRKFPPPDDGD